VAGSLDYGLHYTRALGTVCFVDYCDSDLTDDIDTSKSTSGTMFFFSDSLVSWQSIKHKVVALSSCEDEYIATTAVATQALWLPRLLGELLGRKVDVVELKVDSKSDLALAKNPVFHERSKHIRIKYHFIRADHIATHPHQVAEQDQVPRDEGEDWARRSLISTRLRGRLIFKPSACILLFPTSTLVVRIVLEQVRGRVAICSIKAVA